MKVVVIDHVDGVEALGPGWRALAASADAAPFQRFGWHRAWCRTLGARTRPLVATLSEGVRLVGILPMVTYSRLGLRVLDWMGTGVTDYNDALLCPALDRHAALGAMWDAISAKGGFDVVRWSQMRGDALAAPLAGPRGRGFARFADTAWTMPLPASSGDAWLAGLPGDTRKRAGQGWRRLARAGARFEPDAAAGEREVVIDALIAQKLAWIAGRGLKSPMTRPAGRAFLRRMGEELAAEGCLQLATLRRDDEIVAVDLLLRGADKVYAYTGSYAAGWSKLSPGHQLWLRGVQDAFDRGCREYDLLLGDEGYKQRFGATPVEVVTRMAPATPLGQLAGGVSRLAGRAQRLLTGSGAWASASCLALTVMA